MVGMLAWLWARLDNTRAEFNRVLLNFLVECQLLQLTVQLTAVRCRFHTFARMFLFPSLNYQANFFICAPFL